MKHAIFFNRKKPIGQVPEEWFIFDESYATSTFNPAHLIYRLKKNCINKLINYLILTDRQKEANLIKYCLGVIGYKKLKFVFSTTGDTELSKLTSQYCKRFYLIEQDTLKTQTIYLAPSFVSYLQTKTTIADNHELIDICSVRCLKEVADFYGIKEKKLYAVTSSHYAFTNPELIHNLAFKKITVN